MTTTCFFQSAPAWYEIMNVARLAYSVLLQWQSYVSTYHGRT
jgi:hypothetical protein